MSGSFPPYSLRRVFQQNALGGEPVADRVGAAEIARLLRRVAFVHQRLDARIVVVRRAAREPRGRILLQQAEREAATK